MFIILTVGAVALRAQREDVRSWTDTNVSNAEHSVGWLRSHILDNWFIGLKGGGQLYYGYEDRLGPMADRLTWKMDGHLGHWIFPQVGIRGNLGIASSRGFISLDNYMTYRDSLTRDMGSCWGTTTSDTTIGGYHIQGVMGGYYHPYSNELLKQDWRYLYGGFDLMLNLTFLKQHQNINVNRRWQNIVYAGFNIRFGISEYHPQRTNNTNAANEGHIGYIANWNIWKGLNLSADVRLSIIEGDFDRERIEGVEKMRPDLELSVMGGLTYDFNLRSNATRRRYYQERGQLSYSVVEVPKWVNLIQIEEVEHINIVDTILVYQRYEADSPAIQHYLDSLRGVLDSLTHGIPDDTPLDSILLKRMLPYEMVFFDLDKWDIRPTEEMKIARMARVMKAYPNAIFHLYGSADAKTGTVKRNNFLSHNRADMVYNRLILEYGIKASQLRRDYLGGIMDYDPFILNRTTVIIMEHPAVQKAFEAMKAQRRAGGGVTEVEN